MRIVRWAGLPPAVMGSNVSRSWGRSNYNSTWAGLCTNYALSAKSRLTASKTVLDELRQADIIIIAKQSTMTI